MNNVSAPLLQPPLTICVLCYGDYAGLAERVLASLLDHAKRDAFRLRLGLNAVGAATDQVLEKLLPQFDVDQVVRSEVNLYKDPMLRRLIHDQPIATGWTIWFDDDSYVFRKDWLEMLCCQSTLKPAVDMWGQKCFVRAGDKHREFIRSAPWFRGLELADDDRPGGCRIHFIVGGFWAIRTAWLCRLNWPDPRLSHFAEDYMLGEAMRQHGALIGNAFSGIAINQAPRRVPAETSRRPGLHWTED
jgi:hypothetical protein